MPRFGGMGRSFGRLGANSGGLSGYLNIGAGYNPTWKAKLDQVRAGTARARVLCYGASTTRGVGSGTGANLNVGLDAGSYPHQLATLLNASVPTIYNSLFGAAFATGGSDERCTRPAAWADGGNTLGGPSYFNTTDTSTFAFTPNGAFDKITTWYARVAGRGTYNSNVDGGSSLGTVSTAGSLSVQNDTKTVALGTHTINTQVETLAGGVSIIGIETYNSASPAVNIFNAGFSGVGVATLANTSNATSPLNALGSFAPDLTILTTGGNDQDGGTDETTFKTNLQAIVTKAKLSGDIILGSTTPCSPTGGEDGRRTYSNWIRDIAVTNNCTFIDLVTLMGTYAASVAAGTQANSLHLNTAGYAAEAPIIAKAILV